ARRKTCDRQRNLVAVLSQAFDVVGRIIGLAGLLGHFRKGEKAIEADGRPPEGREIIGAHSQILQRARWIRAAPDMTGARLMAGPIRRPTPPSGGSEKISKPDSGFKRLE